MTSFVIIVVLTTTFGCALALVEFEKSMLFDETDFAIPTVHIPVFCADGCRIYVSMPESSKRIGENIVVHDYINDMEPGKNLYGFSTLTLKFGQKNYYRVSEGRMNTAVNIINNNPNNATAPMAVWIVRLDADRINEVVVLEATTLDVAPTSPGIITIMSAEPFTLRTKSQEPVTSTAIMGGFDAIENDKCTPVVDENNAHNEVQAIVQSPLLTFVYNMSGIPDTKVALSAVIGRADSLDFSGISFAASPGFIGCENGKTFRSSLYGGTTSIKYSDPDRLFDVSITSALNTDENFPVTIKDVTNQTEYNWYGTSDGAANSEDLVLKETNNIQISWTRNETDFEQSFLIRLIPSNERMIWGTTEGSTMSAVPEVSTQSLDILPYGTSTNTVRTGPITKFTGISTVHTSTVATTTDADRTLSSRVKRSTESMISGSPEVTDTITETNTVSTTTTPTTTTSTIGQYGSSFFIILILAQYIFPR